MHRATGKPWHPDLGAVQKKLSRHSALNGLPSDRAMMAATEAVLATKYAADAPSNRKAMASRSRRGPEEIVAPQRLEWLALRQGDDGRHRSRVSHEIRRRCTEQPESHGIRHPACVVKSS